MKKHIMKIVQPLLVLTVAFFILDLVSPAHAQNIKWLRVAELQTPVNAILGEYEGEFTQGNTNYFSWPAQYSIDQNTNRCKSLWIGCRQFDDPVEGKVKGYKVIGQNARDNTSERTNQIFEQELKLIGKNAHPIVVVDDQNATILNTYDLVDAYDSELPCDRMVLVRANTSVGVSVTKKVMSFANSDHGNYTINDYVFKNTGIYNRAGSVKQQTLHEVYFYFSPRYSLAGVSCTGYGLGWGAWSSTWGNSQIIRSFGEDPNTPEFTDPASAVTPVMRGYFSWYGPNKDRTTVSYDEDWGCPNEQEDGTLASAKYMGCLTLHADKAADNPSDDLFQPHTTWYISADINIFQQAGCSQYDEIAMADRYDAMSEGHPAPDQQHYLIVGTGYPIDYIDPRRQTGGGVEESQSYGPYEIPFGDSIHIAFAEAAAGISWEKGREVGANWLQYFDQTGTPTLELPDGSTTTDHNLYKRAWCDTGQDSILKTFRYAKTNYENDYNISQPPSPPSSFTVSSGGDKIMLSWADNATAASNFAGYVIYRSRGTVLDWRTVYEKIFECNAENVVHTFNDLTAVRGFDYYYYIQSKGTKPDGGTIYSSLFWTITSIPATLQRPATPKSPYPPDMDPAFFKVTTNRDVWNPATAYNAYDIVSYQGRSYVVLDSIGIDSALPDTSIEVWKPTRDRGPWVSGSSYDAYDLVSYDTFNYVCLFDISEGKGLDLVRVVPNPYDIRSRMFQFGDKSQYDRIAFYNLPPVCKLRIFTERGDMIWQKDHTRGTGDELWDSTTSSGQIVASGIYILYVEAPGQGSIFRKFVIIR
jgi:hypothetical protein